jgi:hypothetical protein
MNISGLERKLRVVAFVGQRGADAMVVRIQEHLAGSMELQPLEGQFLVCTELVDFSAWGVENVEEAGARLAVELSRRSGLNANNGGSDEQRTEQNLGDRGYQGTPDGAGDQIASAQL